MQVTLKNIGIVENSTIELNGLTVIVGHNNSGKTTVGKALYSVVESVANIDERMRNDTVQTATDTMLRALNAFSMSFKSALRMQVSFEDENLRNFFQLGLGTVVFNQRVDEFFPVLINSLKTFDVQDKSQSNIMDLILHNESFRQYIENNFKREKDVACTILDEFWSEIQNFDLRNYVLTAIDTKLAVEFSGQVQPVANPDVESEIRIYDKDSSYCNLKILKNRVSRNTDTLFEKSPFENALLLDNPFVFDEPLFRKNHRYNANGSLLFNEERVLTHENDLKFYLHTSLRNNLEKSLNENRYKSAKEKVNQIVPGSFCVDGADNLYVEKNIKLQASNLATGSKSFAILKTLLNSGSITEKTLLVLDEPEAHLHPGWQNEFAEVVVLLVKDVGCKVVLTTHSPNFIMAIDAFMRKHQIIDKTNFYKASRKVDGFVEYDCVNDDLDVIYQDFVGYLSEMKMIRDFFLMGKTSK